KRYMLSILPLFLTLCLMAGCGGRSGMHSRLAAVDSIVDSRYDSALTVLRGMDTLQMRRSDRMYLELLRAKAMNKASVPFTSDSVMRRVARYYDRHGSANQRLLAHYLLGCVYRDLGSAPRALEEYQRAASQADTTRADCDLRTLLRIHSQMALLSKEMRLPELQMREEEMAMKISWLTGDTLSALIFEEKVCNRFLYNAQYDTVIARSKKLYKKYIKYGYDKQAAISCINLVKAYLAKKDYDQAKCYLDIYESSPMLEGSSRGVAGGKSSLYIYKGQYYKCIGKKDSAEWCMHEALAYSHPQRNDSTIYRELMDIYHSKHQEDSVNKYALLYASEKERRYNESLGSTMLQLSSLYDYSIEQKIAEEQKAKVQKAKNLLLTLVIVFVFTTVGLFILRYKKQKESEAELEKLKVEIQTSRLTLSQKEIEASKTETLLQKNTSELKEAEARLEQILQEKKLTTKKKDQEIKEANSKIAELEKTIDTLRKKQNTQTLELQQLKANRKSDLLENEAIVEQMLTYVEESKYSQINETHWRRLRAAVECHFPTFHDTVFRRHKLTKDEYRACLLVKTRRFMNRDIETLLGWSYNYSSNKRKHLLKKIFGEEGSPTDFDNRIWEI
ncbi:MAG: hypothetical protein IJ253_05970, partial [Bacteroidaceae bacterium]|nr:hypothetical protein [Bacteroidaceae bacterium]